MTTPQAIIPDDIHEAVNSQRSTLNSQPAQRTALALPPDAPSSVLREDGIESGFIWHTTGSGKTLTSFNVSTLATLRAPLLTKLLSGHAEPNHPKQAHT